MSASFLSLLSVVAQRAYGAYMELTVHCERSALVRVLTGVKYAWDVFALVMNTRLWLSECTQRLSLFGVHSFTS
jgi:chloramphenicol 3-O-phosphotransferase